MSYQFFMSSVPTLLEGEALPFTSARFLEMARDNLTARDMAALCALADGGESSNAFIRAWRDYDTELRNAVARIRASHLGKDSAPYIREHGGSDAMLEQGVTAAFQLANPLEREKALDTLRLGRVRELAGFDGFSLSAVLAYYLRLTVLERIAARDDAEGYRRMNETLGAAPARK